MKYQSILKIRTAMSLLAAVFLSMTGSIHAQVNTPGQGDSMQKPSDSMQPPVTPGKPFEKGTTRGEEAERKNRFDRNQEEGQQHKLNSSQGTGTGQGGGSSTGGGGY